jgi:small conductance mechanosensitive channel
VIAERGVFVTERERGCHCAARNDITTVSSCAWRHVSGLKHADLRATRPTPREGSAVNFDLSKIDFERYAIALASALIILFVGWLVAGWSGSLVRKASERSGKISPTLVPVFSKLTKLSILAVVLLAALEKLGVQTSGFFAMIGAAGLAVGLALKDTVSDVAAGIVLLVLRPFDVGEAVDIGGKGGMVTAIDIFQTKLTSFDGIPIVLNNSSVRTAPIQNYSRAQTRRIDLEIGIGYDSDIGKAVAAVSDVLLAEARVFKDPAILVNTVSLGDSAVVLLARCTTSAADFWNTKLDLTRAIKERLDREGISIPFPQRDVHLYQTASTV